MKLTERDVIDIVHVLMQSKTLFEEERPGIDELVMKVLDVVVEAEEHRKSCSEFCDCHDGPSVDWDDGEEPECDEEPGCGDDDDSEDETPEFSLDKCSEFIDKSVLLVLSSVKIDDEQEYGEFSASADHCRLSFELGPDVVCDVKRIMRSGRWFTLWDSEDTSYTYYVSRYPPGWTKALKLNVTYGVT
jgi:hypothetical protein